MSSLMPSHDNRSAVIEGAQRGITFCSNARGYPKEDAVFDPGFILKTTDALDKDLDTDPTISDC